MIHYIVHGRRDTVGVAVADIEKGKRLTGWNMSADRTLHLRAADNIPLGHKIALQDIGKGQEVIKYDESIGIATRAIRKGQHVHTHNLKTARW